MKVGMNLLLETTHVTPKQFNLLAKAKKVGYDGVEIPIFEGDAAHFKTLRKELDSHGLGCTAVTIATPEANPISPDPAVRKAAVDRMKWVIEMASILGAELLAGPYHSPLAVFTGTGPTADEKKRAAEVLRQVAEEAQKARLMMAIEYLNRFECYFLTTAADTRALVKEVNHPNFRMMIDTFHAHIEEKDLPKTIDSVADIMIHVHVSENDRGTPGTGQVHWDGAFRALRKNNYKGWLMIEAFGRSLPDLAAATKVWRDLFPNTDEVYEKGLSFIKEKWAAHA